MLETGLLKFVSSFFNDYIIIFNDNYNNNIDSIRKKLINFAVERNLTTVGDLKIDKTHSRLSGFIEITLLIK